MKKRILFLTTLNLASNPRLIKEIRLARKLEYNIVVLCFRFNNWSSLINQEFLQEFEDVEIHQFNAGQSNFFEWIYGSVLERFYRMLSRFISLPSRWLAIAVTKRSRILIEALENVERVDWVIGHNPGALYAGIKAAERFKCKAGFDVEDFHPGEGTNMHLRDLTLDLMKRTLSRFTYVSFASPSLMEICSAKIPNFEKVRSIVVNNSFPGEEFVPPASIEDEKMRLVWFSQRIDKCRGLEQIVPIVERNSNRMTLTLLGSMNHFFFEKTIKGRRGVTYGGILSPKLLHQKLAEFDVGLAIEPGKDLNNELALSNKLWAYLQAGLFVIATDTKEQRRFIQGATLHGNLIKMDFSDAEIQLIALCSRLHEVRENRRERQMHSLCFSWEQESLSLIDMWENRYPVIVD
jgi:hypothetical protein